MIAARIPRVTRRGDESRTNRNETPLFTSPVQWFGTKLSDSQNTLCGCACPSRVLSEGADAHGRLPPTGGSRTDGISASDKPHRRGGDSDPIAASPGECVRVFAVPHDHCRMAVGVRAELNSSPADRPVLARPARRGSHGSPHPWYFTYWYCRPRQRLYPLVVHLGESCWVG